MQIEDFQKHELLRVRFDPRITTIVGTNDAGKSAILRALRWVCTNKPDGVEYIRWGVKRSRVRVRIDGRDITRTRGPNQNTYHLTGAEPAFGTAAFRAFGTGVPDEVAAVAQLTDHNFSGQHDPVFLFHETPTMVVRALNAVVDLDIIDNVLGELATQQRRATTIYDVAVERRDAAAKEAEDTAWVEDADVALRCVEAGAAHITALRNQAARLATLTEAAAKHAEAATAAQHVADVGCVVIEKYKVMAHRTKRLAAITQLIGVAERYAHVPPVPDITVATMAYNECRDTQKQLDRLNALIEAVEGAVLYEEGAENHVAHLRVAFKREFKLCPVCGKPI